MPWRDSLLRLKEELTTARAIRLERLEAFDRQVEAERQELLALQASLSITALVEEMNEVLLDGQGEVETTVEWEEEENEGPLDLDDDTADVITTSLSWEEGEELEVLVDVVMLDDGISLIVNGGTGPPGPRGTGACSAQRLQGAVGNLTSAPSISGPGIPVTTCKCYDGTRAVR